MGKLIAPTATEPIAFRQMVTVSDGGNGTEGQLQTVYECLATVAILKSSRLLEANQTRLQQGYEFGIWVDPDFEPKPGSLIQYLDETLTIQGYRYQDNSKQRYVITAIEAAG